MSLDNIIGIAGTALNAQMARMNSTASSLANSDVVSTTEAEAFRAKRPVFKALMREQMTNAAAPYVGGVKVDRMTDDPTPVRKVFEPNNPMADAEGFVFHSNVNEMTEMVEMMAASRAYQNNVEVINTTKQLMMRTLEITRT